MDSLLANYASDEEEEDNEEEVKKTDSSPSSKHQSLSLPKPSFNSNPPPKTSILSSLPPLNTISSSSSSSSSSIFSCLPTPKSHKPIPSKPTNPPSSHPTPKRVIQFKPPLNPSLLKSRPKDDEEQEQEKERKPTKDTPSSTPKPFHFILPSPKNSLGLAPPRRSVIDSIAPAASENVSKPHQEKDAYASHGNYEGNLIDSTPNFPSNENYSSHVNYGYYEGNWVDGSSTVVASESSANVPSNENYVNYEGNWIDGSMATVAPEASGLIESIGGLVGKRGRNEIPTDIIEVKQEELISNRPREDQVKLTGIAFGPSYQV